MLAAATTQTLPGGKLGAIDSAPHPNPEDVRGLAIGATTGERMVVVLPDETENFNVYWVDMFPPK